MTYLELCQETDRILSSQGVILSVETTGYQDMLAGYVANAYRNIQNLRDRWDFLHNSVDITLTQGKTAYSIFDIFATSVDPVANWETNRFIRDDGTTKHIMRFVPYERYVLEDWTDENEPSLFTKNIENNALIFSAPDAAYVITAHYYSKAQVLTTNTQVPLMPSQYDPAIYYQAAADIALKLGIVEVYQLFTTQAKAALGALLRSENPPRKIKVWGIV